MKKLIALSFICAIGVMACTKKAVPATSGTVTPVKTETVATNTETKPATEEKIQADIEGKKREEAKQAGSTPPMTTMDNGKTLFVSKCGTCHALKNTGDYTSAQWDNILKTMAPKAKLSGDETKNLEAYIKANAKM